MVSLFKTFGQTPLQKWFSPVLFLQSVRNGTDSDDNDFHR
jgi:hypothetical protein